MTEKPSRAQIRNSKLQKVAANLFLKNGYEGVTIDRIIDLAGGSRSTIYTEFGGKCGLFISSIENLCRESSDPLTQIDYTGLDLEQSLRKLAFQILKLITAKRSVDLHRLAIAEAAHCPEVGEAWYKYGPARIASFIREILEQHKKELGHTPAQHDRIAVMLHDSLTGDTLYRRLAGISTHELDAELQRTAKFTVEIILAAASTSRTR